MMPPPRRRSSTTILPTPSPSLSVPETLEVKAGIFKNTCLELMDEVRDSHKEIIITKHGKPVAKLVPVTQTSAGALGYLRGTVLSHDDIVSPDFDAWGDLA